MGLCGVGESGKGLTRPAPEAPPFSFPASVEKERARWCCMCVVGGTVEDWGGTCSCGCGERLGGVREVRVSDQRLSSVTALERLLSSVTSAGFAEDEPAGNKTRDGCDRS